MKLFEAPKKSLGGLDAEAAATLITAAADVALIVDDKGVIRDLAFGSEELSLEGYGQWLGRPWAETVTVESRPKVEALLRDAIAKSPPRWRQVNHPSAHGADVPVMYSAVRVSEGGRVVAVGRDLRAMAALQQRLIEAQQSMERDYWKLRHVETRYRLLFQMATEAVLIVDAANQKVVEANPAACQLLGLTVRRLVGRSFPDGFDAASTQAVHGLLAGARMAGKSDDVTVRLADGTAGFLVSASLFRQENSAFFLIRFSPVPGGGASVAQPVKARSRLLDVIQNGPDGLVVTDPEGRVLSANAAFLDLTQIAAEEQLRGELLDRWLGRPGVDFSVLAANLRQHGSVRLFATTLRGEYGATAEVEISGVSMPEGETPCLGFIVRNVGRRLPEGSRDGGALPRSVEQLTELVGRVSMKELVRESSDQIERLCIEAALQLTGDNRASAAEMLGLSRQSLYVKLRRFGLGDLADPEA